MEKLKELLKMFQSARRLCTDDDDKMDITLTSTDIRIITYALSNLAMETTSHTVVNRLAKED